MSLASTVDLSALRWEEELFAQLLYPTMSIGLLGSATVLATIAFRKELHKTRHIFQAVGLVNSMVGAVLGVYGILFLLQRTSVLMPLPPCILYLFIFHRYFLLFGDLLPSIDRCLAIAFPLKYFTNASCEKAIGVCAACALAAASLTVAAWAASVIPEEQLSALPPLTAHFLLLASRRFVASLSLPYLLLAAAVLLADSWSLAVAIRRVRKKEAGRQAGRAATATSSTSHSGVLTESSAMPSPPKTRTKSLSTQSSCSDTQKECASVPGQSLRELRISIRCLATTLWFFSSQMCTFLPGAILFGCADEEGGEQATTSDLKEDSVPAACTPLLSLWLRLLVLSFYQAQFLKFVFYLAMDRDLRASVRVALVKSCGCILGVGEKKGSSSVRERFDSGTAIPDEKKGLAVV